MGFNPFLSQSAPSTAPVETDTATPGDDSAPVPAVQRTHKTPRSTSKANPRGMRSLTDTEVREIRSKYVAARRAARAATTPQQWETSTDTEHRLGGEYGVSATTVHNVVLGLTYTDCGGPIDVARRSRLETYAAEVEIFGRKIAASRARDLVEAASCVQVAVTDPAGKTKTFYYPAGTTVAVSVESGSVEDKRSE